MNDPFVGTLTFARIYSGKLSKGTVLNSVKDEKEKIGEGTHERFVINVPKFVARLAMKRTER